MKNNNKGFTLVELLITTFILAIVATAVTSFMVIGSKTFAKGNADANIQNEAQLAINQIGDMIIDSQGGIEFKKTADKKELIIYSFQNGENIKETVAWNKNEKNISYTKAKVDFNKRNHSYTVISETPSELLAEDVTGFEADISDARDEYTPDGDSYKVVESVKLTAEYKDKNGQIAYATTPLITVRNRMIIDDGKMIYQEPERKPDSEIHEVTVEMYSQKKIPMQIVDGKWQKAYYLVFARATVTHTDADLEYYWNDPDKTWAKVVGPRNTLECTYRIEESDWTIHAGDFFEGSMTATDLNSGMEKTGKDIYRVGDFTAFERGASSNQATADYRDLDPNLSEFNLIAQDYHIEDGQGNTVTHDKNGVDIKSCLSNFKITQGTVFFNVDESLDPTEEYFVKVHVKLKHFKTGEIKDIYYSCYIPAIKMNGRPSSCEWKGFHDKGTSNNLIYGQEGNGNGLLFTVDGYYQNSFTSDKSRLELIPSKTILKLNDTSTLPSDIIDKIDLVFKPQAGFTSEAGEHNKYRWPFSLDLKIKPEFEADLKKQKITLDDLYKNVEVEKLVLKMQLIQHPSVENEVEVDFY